MKITTKKLKDIGFKEIEGAGYETYGIKLWWSPQGYQVDGTNIKINTVEELNRETLLNNVIKFGKYEGKKIRELEDYNYLCWIRDKADPRVMGYGVVEGAEHKIKQIDHYGA